MNWHWEFALTIDNMTLPNPHPFHLTVPYQCLCRGPCIICTWWDRGGSLGIWPVILGRNVPLEVGCLLSEEFPSFNNFGCQTILSVT